MSTRPTERMPPRRQARRGASISSLAPEQRHAGFAAIVLACTLVLPWYEKSYVPRGSTEFVDKGVSGFGAFSWVEAAVLLVGLGVLFLLYKRAQGRAFHLPFGDGTVIMGAGGWAALLLVWRFFDKPDVGVSGAGAATVGIQWGIFVALLVSIGLALTGARLRAARVVEPPLPGEDEGWVEGPRRAEREPRERETDEQPTAITRSLRNVYEDDDERERTATTRRLRDDDRLF